MAGFKFGLKIYDFDWYVQHGLSELEAAKLLRDWQVDFVMLPNRYLPMPDSAVDSNRHCKEIGEQKTRYRYHHRHRHTVLDDRSNF